MKDSEKLKIAQDLIQELLTFVNHSSDCIKFDCDFERCQCGLDSLTGRSDKFTKETVFLKDYGSRKSSRERDREGRDSLSGGDDVPREFGGTG